MSDAARIAAALDGAPVVSAARRALGDHAAAWVVGGAVRDAAIGRRVTDLDLAVTPGAEQSAARAIARELGGHAFPLSGEHATWRAVADGVHADVAALRAEAIEGDLAERDFRLNAIAVPLHGGDLIDPLGGLGDLERRMLRVASPRAFAEDPLRLLRAVRIATDLELTLEPETAELARAVAQQAANPAGERQFAELAAIVAGRDPIGALDLLDELGLTEVVLPELYALRGVEQNRNHHLDVHGHTLEVMRRWLEIEADLDGYSPELAPALREFLAESLADGLTRRDALRWGALVHDVGKPATRKEGEGYVTFIGHDSVGGDLVAGLCSRLRTSRVLSRHLQGLTRHHLRLGFMVSHRPLPARDVYDYLRATEPLSADVTLLTVADRLSARGGGPTASEEMINGHLELSREMVAAALEWRADPPRPPVGGTELAEALGIEPGPKLGRLLEELRAAAWSGEVDGREGALELARSIA